MSRKFLTPLTYCTKPMQVTCNFVCKKALKILRALKIQARHTDFGGGGGGGGGPSEAPKWGRGPPGNFFKN